MANDTMMSPSTEEEKPMKPRAVKWGWGRKETILFVLFASLFLVSGIATFMWGVANKETSSQLFDKVVAVMMDTVSGEGTADSGAHSLSGAGLFGDIFRQNLTVMVFLFLGAALTVYVYPAIVMAVNGAVMGLVMAYFHSAMSNGDLLRLFMGGILPHGVFEITAIILASVMGARWGLSGYRTLGKRPQTDSYKTVTHQTVRVFLVVLLPLLVAAAGIETFVTPHLMP